MSTRLGSGDSLRKRTSRLAEPSRLDGGLGGGRGDQFLSDTQKQLSVAVIFVLAAVFVLFRWLGH